MFGLSAHGLLAWLAPFVSRWSYLLISVSIVLGNLGIPLPEETILLGGGYFAAKGMLTLWMLIPTAIVSATGGDSLGYWLGHRGGRRLLLQHGSAIGMTGRRLLWAERYFEHHGPWTIFVARFIPGLRFMAGPLAGAFGMPFTRFLPYNFSGAVVYCTAVVFVAYFLAPVLDRVIHVLAVANWAIALLVLVMGLSFAGWRLWRREDPRGAGEPNRPGSSAP